MSDVGDPRFKAILDADWAMHCRKAADYGDGEDPLANLRASSELGIEPWLGAVLRAGDKFQRIASLVRNGKLENESVLDSFRDIRCYMALAEILYNEQR